MWNSVTENDTLVAPFPILSSVPLPFAFLSPSTTPHTPHTPRPAALSVSVPPDMVFLLHPVFCQLSLTSKSSGLELPATLFSAPGQLPDRTDGSLFSRRGGHKRGCGAARWEHLLYQRWNCLWQKRRGNKSEVAEAEIDNHNIWGKLTVTNILLQIQISGNFLSWDYSG